MYPYGLKLLSSETVSTVLPERQAAAIAEKKAGNQLLLTYEDGFDTVTAKWVTAR
jgi:hypothetical protein